MLLIGDSQSPVIESLPTAKCCPKGAVTKARTLLPDTVPFVDLTPIYTTAITMEIDNLDLAISLVSLRSRSGKCIFVISCEVVYKLPIGRGPGRRYRAHSVTGSRQVVVAHHHPHSYNPPYNPQVDFHVRVMNIVIHVVELCL
jgi:hypothetical protein